MNQIHFSSRFALVVILLSFLNPSHSYELMKYKWAGSNPVVEYYINEEGTDDVMDEWQHIQDSWKVWENVPTTVLETRYMGKTSIKKVARDNKNIVAFVSGKDWPLGGNVIGVCYMFSNGPNLVEADILFNNRNYKWSTTGEPGKMDVAHIGTHEVGHALGIHHSSVPGAVMWPSARAGDISNRTLHTDDSTAISVLYPRNQYNNRAPVFTSKPTLEAIAGMQYSYVATATDPDDDKITYSLLNPPLNMRIDSTTGKIIWYPKFLDIGSHRISVIAADSHGKKVTQSFTLQVTNLVVYTSDQKVEFKDTIYHDVEVTAMDEFGVFAGNVELSFDPRQVRVLSVDTVGSVIPGASFVRNITNSQVKIAFAGVEPYTGAGRLFRVKLLIHEEYCGDYVQANVTRAFFNDGEPVAALKNGQLYMQCSTDGGGSLVLSGMIRNQRNRVGVGGVGLTMPASKSSAMSDDNGQFEMPVPKMRSSFSLHAAKDSGDIRQGITAYDASLILRYLVGLEDLTDFADQKKAADANGNNLITAYDASLILRYLVKIDDQNGLGTWTLLPEKREFPSLITSQHGVDFEAYLVGDVSGNWGQYEVLAKRSVLATPHVTLSVPESEQIVVAGTPQVAYQTSVAIDTLINNTFSGEFAVEFDSTRFQVHQVTATNLLSGYMFQSNTVGNTLIAVFAGAEPLQNHGKLFDVTFVPRDKFQSADLSEDLLTLTETKLNEKFIYSVGIRNPEQFAHTVRFQDLAATPNPFHARTAISFSVLQREHVQVTVHNHLGQVQSELFRGEKSRGLHTLEWDGRDKSGQLLPPQIYFVRITTPSHAKTLKLVKIR